MSDYFPWITSALNELRGQDLLRTREQVTPLPEGWCEFQGKRLRNFASNDYLNLAHDSRVIQTAREALMETGAGSRASALVCGRTPWHVRLEQALAEFEGHPAALLFPTGYAANLGTISALTGRDDTVFCDRLNHASLVDGCRLSAATFRVYRHDQLDKLERELAKVTSGRKLIVTDSVFSMDGHLAPLPELCDLAERFNAELLIDEAHATGILGEHGRGIAELMGLESRVSIRTGTLSKALGSLGGFVTGSEELITWLWNRARTQVYSTALPPACVAAAWQSLQIVRDEPERRTQLRANTRSFRQWLQELGLETPGHPEVPIVPVILQAPELAVTAAARLRERGYLVAAIRPPTVPQGTSRLRISLTAAHPVEELKTFAQCVGEVVGLLNE